MENCTSKSPSRLSSGGRPAFGFHLCDALVKAYGRAAISEVLYPYGFGFGVPAAASGRCARQAVAPAMGAFLCSGGFARDEGDLCGSTRLTASLSRG